MTFEHLLVRQATVMRAGTSTDRYGNRIDDWNAAIETTVAAWWAQSGGELIQGVREEGVTWDVTLFLRAGAQIHAGDRVRLDGDVFEVSGPPVTAWRPIPQGAHHIEARLKRMEG